MFRTFICVALAAASLCLPASAGAQGRLVIVGGGLQDDNAAVYEAFLTSPREVPDARIAVIAAASGSPVSSGMHMAEVFAGYGFDAGRVDLVQLAVMDDPDTPFDERNWDRGAYSAEQVEIIRNADAVWFTGGDQMRLTSLLLEADGSATPILAAFRERHAQGATLGGTSAGAAIMSANMIQRGDTLASLTLPVLEPGSNEGQLESGRLSLGRGLGFFTLGLVDQHFEERARLGRLARALVVTGEAHGFGIDEDTALIVDPAASVLRVVGEGGVTWIDASAGRAVHASDHFGVEGLRLAYLTAGDQLDWRDSSLDVARYKSATVGNEYFHTPSPSGGGMALPPAGLAEVAGEGLLDNSASQAVERISFGTEGNGVIYRFSQSASSRGYWGRDADGQARYSIVGVDFDILPVRVSVSPVTGAREQADE